MLDISDLTSIRDVSQSLSVKDFAANALANVVDQDFGLSAASAAAEHIQDLRSLYEEVNSVRLSAQAASVVDPGLGGTAFDRLFNDYFDHSQLMSAYGAGQAIEQQALNHLLCGQSAALAQLASDREMKLASEGCDFVNGIGACNVNGADITGMKALFPFQDDVGMLACETLRRAAQDLVSEKILDGWCGQSVNDLARLGDSFDIADAQAIARAGTLFASSSHFAVVADKTIHYAAQVTAALHAWQPSAMLIAPSIFDVAHSGAMADELLAQIKRSYANYVDFAFAPDAIRTINELPGADWLQSLADFSVSKFAREMDRLATMLTERLDLDARDAPEQAIDDDDSSCVEAPIELAVSEWTLFVMLRNVLDVPTRLAPSTSVVSWKAFDEYIVELTARYSSCSARIRMLGVAARAARNLLVAPAGSTRGERGVEMLTEEDHEHAREAFDDLFRCLRDLDREKKN